MSPTVRDMVFSSLLISKLCVGDLLLSISASCAVGKVKSFLRESAFTMSATPLIHAPVFWFSFNIGLLVFCISSNVLSPLRPML